MLDIALLTVLICLSLFKLRTFRMFLYVSVYVVWRTGDNVSLVHVRTAFSMIGKFGISAAFAIVMLYAPEIFPTTLRFRRLVLL